MNKKQISINPQYLNYSSSGKKHTNEKINTNISSKSNEDINANVKNIKELLLKKLKDYKKKKKKRKNLTFTNNFNTDFIEKLKKKIQKNMFY